MKKIFVFLCLLVTCSSTIGFAKAKLEPTSLHLDESGKWTYEKVVEVPNTSKDVLYERMKKWVLTNVKSVDKNTLTDDPNHETLITNVTISLDKIFFWNAEINFKLILEFKENKLRITASSFTYYGESFTAGVQNVNAPLEEYASDKVTVKKIDKHIDERFPAFMTSVENGSHATAKKDW